MAITNDIIPQTVALVAKQSNNGNTMNNLVFKLTPRDHAGALVDFTDATTVKLNAAPQGFDNAGPSQSSLTLGTHDNTGIVCTLTQANQAGINGSLGRGPLAISITVNDGATEFLVATGTLTIQSLP